MRFRLLGAGALAILAMQGTPTLAQNRISAEARGVKAEMSADGKIRVLVEIRDSTPWASIEDSSQIGTLDCGGRYVSVSGRRNRLTLKGECPFVDVSGNGNTLTIEASDHISVSGNDNRIGWRRGIKGGAPEIGDDGKANSIAKVLPN